MKLVIQKFITVATLCQLLEALQHNVIAVVEENLRLKFDANETIFEDAVLTFMPYKDSKERAIVVDDKKYRVEQTTVNSLSFEVDSVDSSDAGKYVYTFKSTSVVAVQVTILDPKPNCTMKKLTNRSISTSLDYILLDCVFAYTGSHVPALKWTEDAMIDLGVSPTSCKTCEQNVRCKIPVRFVHTFHSDALGNALRPGSKNVVATFLEGCNQYKCYWGKEGNVTGLGYTVRLDSSMERSLGTMQCFVFPCRFLKRTIRSTCEEVQGKLNDRNDERIGLIGAVTALSIITVVFGVLLMSACVKNHYLKRRIDFYIDTGHKTPSRSEIRLTQSVNPLNESENRSPVQLVSFRAAEQPRDDYIEMTFPQAADESIRHAANQHESTERVTLPPMPLPSAPVSASATSRSRQIQNEYVQREPEHTEAHPSGDSEQPILSRDYVRLTQREPLPLSPYTALIREHKVEEVDGDKDSDSTSYVNIPQKTRSHYANISNLA